MERIGETSPRFKARMAGACRLLEAITATFGQVIVLDRLVVSGNAAIPTVQADKLILTAVFLPTCGR